MNVSRRKVTQKMNEKQEPAAQKMNDYISSFKKKIQRYKTFSYEWEI